MSFRITPREIRTTNEITVISMGCAGTFAGTKFQEVDSTGATVGDAITVKDTVSTAISLLTEEKRDMSSFGYMLYKSKTDSI